MKKYLSLILTAFCFCACNHQNDAYFCDWEGEYAVTDMIEYIPSDGNATEWNSQETTLTIFQDKNLYVQTLGLGDPFNPVTDPANHTIIIREPSQLKKATFDEIGEEEPEPEESGIENVVVTNRKSIVLIDGGVYSVYGDGVYSSKAIEVLSATEDQLILRPGKQFEVALTNEDGINIETLKCNWIYTSIQKTNDTYSWTAELHMNSTSPAASTIRHTITMTKK